MMTPDAALKRFRTHALNIWGDELLASATFQVRVDPKSDSLAAIAYKLRPGRPDMAKNGVLKSLPLDKTYTLIVTPKLLEFEPAKVDRALIHEAVHIGYPKHSKKFIDLVQRHGGAVTHSDFLRGEMKVYVQKKQGHRYVTVREFSDMEQAKKWLTLYAIVNPGKYRYRY